MSQKSNMMVNKFFIIRMIILKVIYINLGIINNGSYDFKIC